MSRTVDLVMLVSITAVCGWFWAGRQSQGGAPWSPESLPSASFELNLAALENLNGKTTAELTDLRGDALARCSQLKSLVPKDYDFAKREVFAQVGSAESWNGQFGTLYGTAENQMQTFSQGLSWESFVVLNPFVLGSLYSHYGCWSQRPDEELKKRWLVSEIPSQASWDGSTQTLTVRYIQHGVLPEYRHRSGTLYNLNLINARDLGLGAFAIVGKDSSGIYMGFDRIYPNHQAYVCDAVPGSPHKLNNLLYGPPESEVVKVNKLPARVHVAFWRQLEGAQLSQPDFNEVIEIDNDSPNAG